MRFHLVSLLLLTALPAGRAGARTGTTAPAGASRWSSWWRC